MTFKPSRWFDFVLAGLLGAGTYVLLVRFDLPMLSPELWDEALVACGVRPAAHLTSGYFGALSALLYRLFGKETTLLLLGIFGKAAFACIAMLTYAMLRVLLSLLMRARQQESVSRPLVMCTASFVGTCAFIASAPVWHLGAALSETAMLLTLTMLSLAAYFAFQRKGTLFYAHLCALFLGLLSAETPAGPILLVLLVFLNRLVMHVLSLSRNPEDPETYAYATQPAQLSRAPWTLSSLFCLAGLLGVAVNLATFIHSQGLDLAGMSLHALPGIYLTEYVKGLFVASTIPGWMLWLVVALVPLAVSLVRFPIAADEERFLSHGSGVGYLVFGAAALSQVAPFETLWTWPGMLHSDYMIALGLLSAATTITLCIAVFGVDAFCRDHSRLAEQFSPWDKDDEDAEEADHEPIPKSTILMRRVALFLGCAAILALLAPNCPQTTTRRILNLVRDMLEETVHEAEGATHLISDGHLDAGIEWTAFCAGKSLVCLPLIPPMSDSPRSVHLRTRGLSGDVEERAAFADNVGVGLQTWIREKPQRLATCAAQLGFDLWTQAGKSAPPLGGVLARPSGWTAEASRLASIERARRLAQRVLTLQREAGEMPAGPMRDALLAVSWRLARMCTYRGEADLAQRLNDGNPTYQRVADAMASAEDVARQRLTPAQSVRLAIQKGDFEAGRDGAEKVLSVDPSHVDANFVVSVCYIRQKQFEKAEEHLKLCVEKRPGEATFWNNLAMVEIELGRIDDAETHAKRAEALKPNEPAIQNTLKRIQALRDAAKQKDEEPR